MFQGHNPYLVALSVVMAVLGGYTGFGLMARIGGTHGVYRRILLVGAAGFLAVGIWTMHFIGMLAAPLPVDATYLVLPTIVSFLICALVVGVSLFFVSVGAQSVVRLAAAALLLGAGICSMHYVGIHGLAGDFSIRHDPSIILLSVMIAVATAYGALSIYVAPQAGLRLAISAVAFGIAVSGMHYTAMYGMHFDPGQAAHLTEHNMIGMSGGLEASPQVLSLVIAFLCFLIAAGFLLILIPEPWERAEMPHPAGLAGSVADLGIGALPQGIPHFTREAENAGPLVAGMAVALPVARVPVQGASGTQFVDVMDIRSIRADAHYTWVHDGNRERMCSWSISEAEGQLDPGQFSRVHRSYIIALRHVTLLRKEGDGAVVELDGAIPHLVPVSRAKAAEVKARLGLAKRPASR